MLLLLLQRIITATRIFRKDSRVFSKDSVVVDDTVADDKISKVIILYSIS